MYNNNIYANLLGMEIAGSTVGRLRRDQSGPFVYLQLEVPENYKSWQKRSYATNIYYLILTIPVVTPFRIEVSPGPQCQYNTEKDQISVNLFEFSHQ